MTPDEMAGLLAVIGRLGLALRQTEAALMEQQKDDDKVDDIKGE